MATCQVHADRQAEGWGAQQPPLATGCPPGESCGLTPASLLHGERAQDTGPRNSPLCLSTELQAPGKQQTLGKPPGLTENRSPKGASVIAPLPRRHLPEDGPPWRTGDSERLLSTPLISEGPSHVSPGQVEALILNRHECVYLSSLSGLLQAQLQSPGPRQVEAAGTPQLSTLGYAHPWRGPVSRSRAAFTVLALTSDAVLPAQGRLLPACRVFAGKGGTGWLWPSGTAPGAQAEAAAPGWRGRPRERGRLGGVGQQGRPSTLQTRPLTQSWGPGVDVAGFLTDSSSSGLLSTCVYQALLEGTPVCPRGKTCPDPRGDAIYRSSQLKPAEPAFPARQSQLL